MIKRSILSLPKRFFAGVRLLGGFVGITALFLTAFAGDCSQVNEDTTVIHSLEPAAESFQSYVGDQITLKQPFIYDENLSEIDGVKLQWETSNPNILQLTSDVSQTSNSVFRPSMVVKVLAPGTATVTMKLTNVHFVNNVALSYVATIVATQQGPTILDVPSSVSTRLGDLPKVTPAVRATAGGPAITTGSYSYEALDPTLVQVQTDINSAASTTSNGTSVLLKPIALGQGRVRVTWTGSAGATLTQTINVYVLPAGSHVAIDRQFSATTVNAYSVDPITASLLNSSGASISPGALQFVSRDPSIVTVAPQASTCGGLSTACNGVYTFNNTNILARGGSATAWIVVSGGAGATPDSLLLTVYAGPETLDLTPLSGEAILGSSLTFTATPRDAAQRAIPIAAISGGSLTFAQANGTTGLVSVDAIGGFQGLMSVNAIPNTGLAAVGVQASLRVYHGGVGSQLLSAIANINLRAVKTVTVTPANTTLSVGDTRQYVATATDGAGRTVTLPFVTAWRTGSTASATITNPGGLLTAVAAGSGQVFAVINGVEGNTGYTISALTAGGAPASILIAPKPSAPFAAGQSQQFTATLLDAQGRPTLPGTGGTISIIIDNSNTGAISASSYNTALLRQEFTLRGITASSTNLRAFYRINGVEQFGDFVVVTVTP